MTNIDPSNPALACRAFGHSWDQIPSTEDPSFGVYVCLRCIHCHSIRKDIVAPHNGNLLSRWYEHSEEFSQTKGPLRSRASFRADYLTTDRSSSLSQKAKP